MTIAILCVESVSKQRQQKLLETMKFVSLLKKTWSIGMYTYLQNIGMLDDFESTFFQRHSKGV